MSVSIASSVLWTRAVTVQAVSHTHNYVIIEASQHVRSELRFFKYKGGGSWESLTPPGEAGNTPVGQTVSVSAIWPDETDDLWLHRAGFLNPSSLELASATDLCASTEPLKAMPSHFDASGLECTQHFATSKDGTRVPYFQIGPKDLKLDGSR